MQRKPTSQKSGSNAPYRLINSARRCAARMRSKCYTSLRGLKGEETKMHKVSASLLPGAKLRFGDRRSIESRKAMPAGLAGGV
jgi:hypothetical protein